MSIEKKNRTTMIDNQDQKLFEFFKNNIGNGSLDIMTGYWNIGALAFIKEQLNQVKEFRIILGNIPKENIQANTIIDLINQTMTTTEVLLLNYLAKQAIEFLRQDKVHVRLSRTHAKLYIYKDSDESKNFYLLGSSNLTEAGLGLKESDHIELNEECTGDIEKHKKYMNWFNKKWEESRDIVKSTDGREIPVKQYIIELIEKFVKEYDPGVIYHKTLYEIFKNDLLSYNKNNNNEEISLDIGDLEKTNIYKMLYPYQQKGVISLIKKLEKHNGAILADAVGLGKTWTALAVMKYFQMKGYSVVLFCPKRLRNNWEQYKSPDSIFQQDDLEYYIRNHTDLQNKRLSKVYPDFPLEKLQRKQKLLLVIDESHNFRNDKSSRYEFLVKNVLLPEKNNRDVKVLLLSATPINNSLIDLRNQFKLIVRGLDNGFENTKLQIDSLEQIFKVAQRNFSDWTSKNSREISYLIASLPEKVKALIDALVIARTRKMIQEELNSLGIGLSFPKKEPPINEFVATEIGELKSIYDILDAMDINLTAYRPANYIKGITPKSALEDENQRQKFLVKMMYILLVKRLESSWFSFKISVENVLNYHNEVLDKVEKFLEKGVDVALQDNLNDEDEEIAEVLKDSSQAITIGRRKLIPISDITDINLFKKHLQEDIEKLSKLKNILVKYEKEFKDGKVQDKKLNKLIEYIRNKQNNSTNKKVLIFTAFNDTAEFLYRELQKRGIERIALISGSVNKVYDNYPGSNFESILERFAHFTKLYKEKDWSELYERANLSDKYRDGDIWNVPYEVWLDLVKKYDQETLYKIQNPVDVLIATDCLSEGQNLQDCDMIINYDIHWNPVRLIQRMGRIDRIGSPNKVIKGVNFWPGSDYDEFLDLKSKVERKMALMTLVGTEIDCKITPELEKMIKENPLLTQREQEMLDQLQRDWVEVGTIEEALRLEEFSWEQFRQELFEFLKQNISVLKQIPLGVFTGFRIKQNSKWKNIPNSIIAVLGFPKQSEEAKDHKYDEVHLLHLSIEDGELGKPILTDKKEILRLIHDHKFEPRYVPTSMSKGEKDTVEKIVEAINKGLKTKVKSEALNNLHNTFSGDVSPKKAKPKQKAAKEKFKTENLDLIALFIISNK